MSRNSAIVYKECAMLAAGVRELEGGEIDKRTSASRGRRSARNRPIIRVFYQPVLLEKAYQGHIRGHSGRNLVRFRPCSTSQDSGHGGPEAGPSGKSSSKRAISFDVRRELQSSTYDERRDASSKERVDEIRVELYSGLVHGVIAASERNNSGPRQGETVGFDAILGEEVEVVLPAFVGVGRNIAVASVESLAG